jgi:UDP-N-acetylmuramoylalanine--D-glutamate ligase
MTQTKPTPKALARLVALTEHFADRRIGVFGMGVTGVAMAVYMARRGAQVRCVDARLDIAPLPEELLRTLPIVMRLGDVPEQVFDGCEGVAVSPGIPPDHPAVRFALAQNVPVFGELELCVPLPAPCIAITGTNGKSTTTALTGALAQGLQKAAFVGGNLGDPIAGWLDAQPQTDVAVLELSSYQIDLAYRFAPEVVVVLNLSPDHLSRYKNFGAYAASKNRLVTAAHPKGRVILNYDDAHVRAMAPTTQAPIWWLSTEETSLAPGLDGAAYDPQRDHMLPQGALAHLGPFDLAHPRLLGRHNKQNAMAALLSILALFPKTRWPELTEAYTAFEGLEHRLEVAGELDEVQYINDSKATNDASAATAVLAMQRPCILLVGGVDKGGGYALLMQACQQQNMRHVIAFGAAAPLIVAAMAGAAWPIAHVTNLEDALALARKIAEPNDVVLMAPACSSFDAYADYKHRGRAFKDWVRRQGARS